MCGGREGVHCGLATQGSIATQGSQSNVGREVALEDADMRSRIGHELDASDEELEKAFQHLESKLNEEPSKDVWMEWLDANSYGMKSVKT